MATIYIDNRPYNVADGQNLLQACLTLGFDLPYFCWHPAMHSVGACRQCAVKQFTDESDTRGRIVMACMTPATDGTRISVDDHEAKAFRASVIEWLMENHPHDCPVCDEGGECHLQDMTLMTGHDYRRYRFGKRTYRNQDLGPFVNHEMNRCIQCYRCVRFYQDYAGGRDLNVFGAHDQLYFGRAQDGVLENEFSGNLVEICPTGVFTDKTLKKNYTRKWDLETAPSICVHCSLGCNTIPGGRYGKLRRIRNRYNGQVNGYFLCDRGRFGYEFVNSDLRVGLPPNLTEEGVIQRLAEIVSTGAGVIGIGSPRASLESNFALRSLVGPDRFYQGVSATEARLTAMAIDLMRRGPAPSPSLQEIASCDAVLVLGEDLTNSAPVMALALRQSVRQQPFARAEKRIRVARWNDYAIRTAAQQEMGPFYLATVGPTKLEEVATRAYHGAPDDLARLGFAVARAIYELARTPEGSPGGQMGMAENVVGRVTGEERREELDALATEIAAALGSAERPLVIAGTGQGSESLLRAAAGVAWALRAQGKQASLSFVFPECNSLGLGMMGGGSLDDAFAAVGSGRVDTAIVLENDLFRRAAAGRVDAFLEGARHLVVLDHLHNASTERAELLLPAATFAEADGSLVNNEGRAQRFFQLIPAGRAILESWRWLGAAIAAAGTADGEGWRGLDDVIASMVKAMPQFGPVAEAAPPAGFRIAGQKVAREHQRFSGRTAMYANIDVSEPKPPDDPDSPLTFSMEGYQGQPPSSLIPRFWAPRWNSVQSVNRFQEEVGGPLRGGDPGRRLIEPAEGRPSMPPAEAPAPFEPRPKEWLAVPMYHIFGSDELSILTPGVAERSPRPYMGLSLEEAREQGFQDGDQVELDLGGRTRRLEVRVIAALPSGVVGLPVGLPELLGVELPAWIPRLRGKPTGS